MVLDDNLNPPNGNVAELDSQTVLSAGTTVMGSEAAEWTLLQQATPAGSYAVHAEISTGGRTRCLYAPEILQPEQNLIPPLPGAPQLGIDETRIAVRGYIGHNIGGYFTSNRLNSIC